jgi:hypothetical protein
MECIITGISAVLLTGGVMTTGIISIEGIWADHTMTIGNIMTGNASKTMAGAEEDNR